MVTQSVNLATANVLEMECSVRVIRKAFPVSRFILCMVNERLEVDELSPGKIDPL